MPFSQGIIETVFDSPQPCQKSEIIKWLCLYKHVVWRRLQYGRGKVLALFAAVKPQLFRVTVEEKIISWPLVGWGLNYPHAMSRPYDLKRCESNSKTQ